MRTLSDAVAAYRTIARANGLSEKTIYWVSNAARYFGDFLGEGVSLEAITAHDMRRWVVALRGRNRFAAAPYVKTKDRLLSPTAINDYVRAVKQLFGTLVREEIIEDHEIVRYKAPKTPKLVIKPVPDQHLKTLFSELGKTEHPLRNRAMAALAWDCCLRLSEVATLKVEDVDLERREIKVWGKGAKERLVPIGQWTAKALLLYKLKERPETTAETFFVSEDGQPLRPGALSQVLRRIEKRTGIKCNPHRLRHTGALGLVRNGMDAFRVQKILGHADLAMTRRYVNLADVDLKDAYHRANPADKLRLRL